MPSPPSEVIQEINRYRDAIGFTPAELAVLVAVTAVWQQDGLGTTASELEAFLGHVEGFASQPRDAVKPLREAGLLEVVARVGNAMHYAPSLLCLQKIAEWRGVKLLELRDLAA